MGLYDDIKLLKHNRELENAAWGRIEKLVPIHVRIEPTEACNFRCVFCWWHSRERSAELPSFKFTGKTHLPLDRFMGLLSELHEMGTKAISLTGAGDPLMYPDIADILKRVVHLGISFGVTSNMAMPMSDELVTVLAKAKWLRWSINAGSAKIYSITADPGGRNPDAAFVRARENVGHIVRRRDEEDDFPAFNASYVVTDINQGDIIAAAELVRGLGLDSIAFRPDTPLERQADANIYMSTVAADIRRAKEQLQTDGFKIHMNEIRQEDVKKTGDPELLCFYSNHTAYIDANGDVYPCCYTRFSTRYIIGNILDKSFKEFWNHPSRLNYYRKLLQDRCPACGYGQINKALKDIYLKGKVPSSAVERCADDDFI